jgi:hypothetical protein
MKLRSFAVLLALRPTLSTGKYIWPSAYDEIEDIFSLQAGYAGRNFSSG